MFHHDPHVHIVPKNGPTWSQSNTRDLSTAVLEGVWDTSGESVLHSLVESWRASIRLAGAPAMVAGLTERDHVLPSGKGTDGSGLGPFGCPEPFFLIDSAELRLACCEKNTTGVRQHVSSNFLFCLASHRRFAYPTCRQEHGTFLVLTTSVCRRPAMPLNFSAFTTMALSKEAVNPKESPATGAKLSKGK